MRPTKTRKVAAAAMVLGLLSVAPANFAQRQPGGAIEGRVTQLGTADGVSGALVLLSLDRTPALATGAATIMQSRAIDQVVTGSDGGFRFSDLPEGTYRLTVTADGFAQQEYGQKLSSGIGRALPLQSGQTIGRLAMELVQAAAVTGRITDGAGRPVADVPVMLLRSRHTATGKTHVVTATARTDDRGLYRLFGIAPGRYVVGAGNGPTNRPVAPANGPQPPISDGRYARSYTLTYYPNTLDPDLAPPVDLPAGADVAGVDIQIGEQLAYRVSGRVVDPRTGQPPSTALVSILYQTYNGSGGRTQPYNPATGTFEVSVIPGVWTVEAEIRSRPASGSPGPGQASERAAVARTTFRVTGSDVGDLVLTPTPGTSITGRLQVEDSAESALSTERVRVELAHAEQRPASLFDRAAPSGQPNTDGSFRLEGVQDGRYTTSVTGLPTGYYVASIQFSPTGERSGPAADILNKPLSFTSTAGAINIRVRKGSGELRGLVTDARGKPMPGLPVVLAPDQGLDRADLYKVTLTNQDGRYLLTDIVPADYRLYAWEDIEPGALYDPDFMKTQEPFGRRVHIGESTRGVADVSVLAASKP